MQKPGVLYGIEKTYEHSVGLSCCFRQWRATHSHCQYLHGYAIQVTLNFATAIVGEDGWVVDYGGLKEVKQWLVDNFDHKTIVANSDPLLGELREMEEIGLLQLTELPEIGTENFAAHIMDHVETWLKSKDQYKDRVFLRKVEVREHGGNAAYVERVGP
jgi:6-pyruvoyltetrahydropterin/6-carboxytetrahydropterin synthase